MLCLFLSISNEKAAGPVIAIVSTQMLVLVMASSLLNGLVPNLLQWMGLLFGLIGALILVIPNQMKQLAPCLFKDN